MGANALSTLVLAALSSLDGGHTQSAAFVIDGSVVVVDVANRRHRTLEVNGVPEEADVSPDGALVAFNAYPEDGGYSRIFLHDVRSGVRKTVSSPSEGDNRFPRFAENGTVLYFSGAKAAAGGGPSNPGRLFRVRMRDGSIEEVGTRPNLCSFSPVGVGPNSVAHVTTPCGLSFELSQTDVLDGGTTVLTSLSSPTSELAASPDGRSLVYTTETRLGRSFFLYRPQGKSKLLASVATGKPRLQPRFVSDRRLVFSDTDQVWLLDSKSGRLETLLTLPGLRHEKERKP
jgi:Tol biopolymer transport system component